MHWLTKLQEFTRLVFTRTARKGMLSRWNSIY